MSSPDFEDLTDEDEELAVMRDLNENDAGIFYDEILSKPEDD